jgi:hypothetical protein
MAIAAGSQAVSAVQLAMLLGLAGASKPVDGFLVGLAFIQAPTNMIVIGILYPLRLSRPHPGPWPAEQLAAATAGAVLGLAGAGVVSLQQGAATAQALAPWLVLTGAASSAVAVMAVVLACHGRSEALVSLPLIPSTCAILGLLSGLHSGDLAVTQRMVIGLAIGNLIAYAVYARALQRSLAQKMVSEDARPSEALRWLVIGSVVGFGAQLGMQTGAGSLDTGDATVWGLLVRISGFASFVGVTAIIPRFLNWDLEPGEAVGRLARWFLAPAAAVGIAASVLVRLLEPGGDQSDLVHLVPLLICWVGASSANSLLTSSSDRLGRFRSYRLATYLTVPIYVAGIGLLVLTKDLRVAAGTAAAAAAVSCLCMLRVLRWRGIAPYAWAMLGATAVASWL